MWFSDKIKVHLSNYKNMFHSGIPNGTWRKNNYSHIFPANNYNLNFLSSYRNDIDKYVIQNNIPKHSCIHHLNSSQAMCLNYFFSMYYENKLESITNLLGQNNLIVDYYSVEFEKKAPIPHKMNPPTKFDFYFKTTSGKHFYFEIKYTESHFGKKYLTPNNLNIFQNYIPYVNLLSSGFQKLKGFYDHYQIARNLINISNDVYVVFVYPDNNYGIKNAAQHAKNIMLKRKYRNNLILITWENLVQNISKISFTQKLINHFNDFEIKYMP